MGEANYPVDVKGIKEGQCPFNGCYFNRKGQCYNWYVLKKVNLEKWVGQIDCRLALVPEMVCDFCGSDLNIKYKDQLSCPNGCF